MDAWDGGSEEQGTPIDEGANPGKIHGSRFIYPPNICLPFLAVTLYIFGFSPGLPAGTMARSAR